MSDEMELNPSEVTIVTGPGRVIQCLSGMVWITQEGDPRDHVLTVGRIHRIDRPGRVALQALKASRVRIHPPGEWERPAAA